MDTMKRLYVNNFLHWHKPFKSHPWNEGHISSTFDAGFCARISQVFPFCNSFKSPEKSVKFKKKNLHVNLTIHNAQNFILNPNSKLRKSEKKCGNFFRSTAKHVCTVRLTRKDWLSRHTYTCIYTLSSYFFPTTILPYYRVFWVAEFKYVSYIFSF